YTRTTAHRSDLLLVTRPPTPRSPPRPPNAGGGGWIRTNEDVRRQIYSLLPLTTRQPLRIAGHPAQREAGHMVSAPICQSGLCRFGIAAASLWPSAPALC